VNVRDYPYVSVAVPQRRNLSWLAWGLVGAAALLFPLTLYLGLSAGNSVQPLLRLGWWGAVAPVVALSFGVVGALIVRRQPRHAVGWLAVIGGYMTVLAGFAGAYAAHSVTHADLPGADFAAWLRVWLWYPAFASLFILVPAFFPDGRLPSRRWRLLVWTVAAGSVGQLLLTLLPADRPPALGGWLLEILNHFSNEVQALPLFAAVAALALRFRRSSGATRQQMKWFLAAVVLQAVLWVASLVATATTGLPPYQTPYFEFLIPFALLAMPLAIGLAILRYRLYDVDLVLSRGLAYAGLAGFITVAYLLVVIGIGLAVGTAGRPNLPLSILATAVVAVLFQPVRVWVQRLANRLVYGTAADPYEVLAELSRTVAAADIDQAMARIAEAVARGMGRQRSRIRLLLAGGQDRTASWPPGAAGTFGPVLTVSHQGQPVGEIEVEGSADGGLTAALTGQAALALRTLHLSAELAARLEQLEAQAVEVTASRTRLVQAQESERRRLERDLHDGVQQELVALIAKLRLGRNQLARDPEAAAETLVELQSAAQHALADLRALARGIHPAVLSSRGLVEAVNAMAARMPVAVRVEADRRVRESRYPPEIEGAAYFVVAEGLANVLKHSGATDACVSVSHDGSCLRVVIADDGRGFDAARVHESGLRGLHDRVEALGGQLEVDSRGPGTRVDASIPTGEAAHG
jgi:signal transduction histidine kinase